MAIRKWAWTLAVAAMLIAPHATYADEITLLYGTGTPQGTHISLRVFHPWAERINAQGKGIINIDIRDGMALSNPTNYLSRVLDDVIQVGWGSQSGSAGTFPLTGFSTIPFQAERSEDASVAFWRLYKSGLLDSEYKNIVPLVLMVYPQAQIHLTKAPKTMDDLAGLRLSVAAKNAADSVAKLGGAPSSLPLNDLYQGLARNTVDGTVIAWTAFQPFKLAEVTTYHYETQFGAAQAMVFMARTKYDALPAAARKIIDDNSGEAESRALGKAWDEVAEEARVAAKADPKQQVVTPTPAQAAKWQAATASIATAWAQATPGGDKVLASFHQALADVKAGK